MIMRPSTASQREQMKILRTQLRSVSSCQTEDGHSLDGGAAVHPVSIRSVIYRYVLRNMWSGVFFHFYRKTKSLFKRSDAYNI